MVMDEGQCDNVLRLRSLVVEILEVRRHLHFPYFFLDVTALSMPLCHSSNRTENEPLIFCSCSQTWAEFPDVMIGREATQQVIHNLGELINYCEEQGRASLTRSAPLAPLAPPLPVAEPPASEDSKEEEQEQGQEQEEPQEEGQAHEAESNDKAMTNHREEEGKSMEAEGEREAQAEENHSKGSEGVVPWSELDEEDDTEAEADWLAGPEGQREQDGRHDMTAAMSFDAASGGGEGGGRGEGGGDLTMSNASASASSSFASNGLSTVASLFRSVAKRG